MASVQEEIAALEEKLRLAELGPDPHFYQEFLADNAVLVDQNGRASFGKPQVVEAHRPGKGPKFTRVEMSDIRIVDQGDAAVVTCKGFFEGPQFTGTLKFLRVWLKKNGRWQIVAASISSA